MGPRRCLLQGHFRVKIDRYWIGTRLGSARISRSRNPRKETKNWRWAAEPPGDRPYGPRSHEIKQAQALASVLLAPRITEASRLRDQRRHILERRRESGAAFQDGHSSSAERARGVLWAELETIDRYRRHHQIRWLIDIPDKTPDDQGAALAGYEIQEIGTRARPPKYGRPGRKPNGDHPMTTAERVRNHRARKKTA
jgi:hypothetical protein